MSKKILVAIGFYEKNKYENKPINEFFVSANLESGKYCINIYSNNNKIEDNYKEVSVSEINETIDNLTVEIKNKSCNENLKDIIIFDSRKSSR